MRQFGRGGGGDDAGARGEGQLAAEVTVRDDMDLERAWRLGV